MCVWNMEQHMNTSEVQGVELLCSSNWDIQSAQVLSATYMTTQDAPDDLPCDDQHL